MKASRDNPQPARRDIFILTLEEKKTVCFVLVAFVLGLATNYYRDRHPAPLPKPPASVREKTKPRPPRPLHP